MLVLGERRISRRHRENQFCQFDVPVNGNRRRGRRRLFVVADKSCAERFCAGLGWCNVAQGDACVSLSTVLRIPARRNLGSRKTYVAKDGLFWLLHSRLSRSRHARATVCWI